MDLKKTILICTVIVLFASLIAVSATSSQQNTHNLQEILENNNQSDMTGCCSVVLQLDGNNSILTFRRDSETPADIYIEKIDWHGKEAIKQYKTTGGYFCQVIITNDGWTIGYGGIDDGVDNEKIENITGKMLENSTEISESVLNEIMQIKSSYGLGHMIIKAPNGTYGVATANSYYTGKLEPNDYISIPNRDQYIRTGDVLPNATDKIKTMTTLALSDGFGLTRRDVTTFVFSCENDTNVTDVYVANDDGSYWGMSTGGLADNINFLGNVTEAGDIPIAPQYKYLGNITFENDNPSEGGSFNFLGIILYAIIAVIIGAVIFFSYHFVRVLRYRRRYYKR